MIKSPHDPGYIKGYVPGIRENGGQYTHAAVWTLIAFAALGDGDKAGELFRMLNPIHRASTRAECSATKWSPTWWRGTCTLRRRMWGAAAGLGTRARPGGSIARASSGCSDSGCKGSTLFVDPCIPRNWPSYTIRFRYHSAIYQIRVDNPSSVTRGVVMTEVEERRSVGVAGVPLVDDGALHHVRVLLG